MNLRPTHLGYLYQDLLTAIRLVDVVLDRATAVVVDTKMFDGDLFDDLTTMWRSGQRERLQIKHTTADRELPRDSFTTDRRGLRLGKVLSSVVTDLHCHPGTSYRLVLRDQPPDNGDLTTVLRAVDPQRDPGPSLQGLGGRRMRFNAAALRATASWRASLGDIDADALRRACDALVVEVGMPHCSLDIRNPGPAELALLRRVADELGAGRPPNRHRTPEDVALALIESAASARAVTGTVTKDKLEPRLDLAVDFGAVHAGNPVDRTVEILRQDVLGLAAAAVDATASAGGVAILSGEPGAGKSWLCEQLADQLSDNWIVARHHCWLGAADAQRERRVLTDVVVGSLLGQLEDSAPESVAAIKPRFAATVENLRSALEELRRTQPDRRVVLIVDGLDHVSRVLGRTEGAAFGRPEDPAAALVTALAALEPPNGVALVLASQPGEHLDPLCGAVDVAVPPLTSSEVRQLAQRVGVLAAFEPTVDPADTSRVDEAVALIHGRSRGNALYATYLCRAVLGASPALIGEAAHASITDPLARLREVPPSAESLDDYYAYLFSGLTAEQKAAVGLLAVCDFAVTAAELREIFPLAAPMLPAALSTVAPIVTQQPAVGGLKIHHESFSRFIRRVHDDESWLTNVREHAAAWLARRGFFTDARAFRRLPEILAALNRDGELSALIGQDFLANAIAGLQPPTAITHVLDLVAQRCAANRDWPALVRLVQLRGAADSYETGGIPDTIVDYADVLVELLGAEAVAFSLIYDGLPTVPPRWGLQLCAAADAAGAAAPWATYTSAWDDARERERVAYGRDHDDALQLAVLRGQLRLESGKTVASAAPEPQSPPAGTVDRLVRYLLHDQLPPLRPLLAVFVDCLGAATTLEAARLIREPARRAELLLHLADMAGSEEVGLPAPRALAEEAWAASRTVDPLRMLHHGLPASEVADPTLGPDVGSTLQAATADVLTESVKPEAVRRWLTCIVLAQQKDPRSTTRVLAELEGVGFYRAWLRFAAATAGLRHDVDAGVLDPEAASATVRIAVSRLAESAEPFTGRPRACDLWSIHGQVQAVLHDAVVLLTESDLEPALAALMTISDGTTTTSNLGTPPSGPLITTDLLMLLSRTMGRAFPAILERLADELRKKETGRGTPYPQLAAFELEMSRITLTAGNRDEALRCWERAAGYMSCYGSHKDSTIYELLEPLTDLAAANLAEARARLARLRRLTYLTVKHTDGRGTSETPISWWRALADLDPVAAANHASAVLLAEPGLEDARADAAHRQLLSNQAVDADPVILAALRVAAGPGGRDLERDVALLGRLAGLPTDDRAREFGILPVLANAITATYDDQSLMYASSTEEPEPDERLCSAAHRLGGDGARRRGPARPAPTGGTAPSYRSQPTLAEVLHASQRPDLPPGAAGVVAAVRDHASKPFGGDPTSARWAADAIGNAVGWRLLLVAINNGADAAAALLGRLTDECEARHEAAVLGDVAVGLDLRRHDAPEVLVPLASAAYTMAFTTLRGRGGWFTFAGRDRLDLWQRAVTLDSGTATRVLAAQVAKAFAGRSHATTGITEALVAAFAAHPPEQESSPAESAFACWDAAFAIIERRLPGTSRYDDDEIYAPGNAVASQSARDISLARLALSTVAMPARDDRRRALVAATVLLSARPIVAQTAISEVLAAELGSGPLTWLLTVLRESLDDGVLVEDLTTQLARLARSDLLAVRVLAADILENAHRRAPDAPATPAHPALRRGIAESFEVE